MTESAGAREAEARLLCSLYVPYIILPIDHIDLEEGAKMTDLITLEAQQESPDTAIASPMPQAPRWRTPARMRTYFLRQFERSGSLMEACSGDILGHDLPPFPPAC